MAEESAMSMLGEDDKVWDMLEKLRTGWRLEEYGFIPATWPKVSPEFSWNFQ